MWVHATAMQCKQLLTVSVGRVSGAGWTLVEWAQERKITGGRRAVVHVVPLFWGSFSLSNTDPELQMVFSQYLQGGSDV